MPDIFGDAITDYFNGKTNAEITVSSVDFEDDVIPVSYLFRGYSEMPKIEQLALKNARGKVLDVGCGAGSHALYLQERGLDVLGIDTSKGAIAIALKRGLKKAKVSTFLEVEGTFDTILFLMNGTGIIGTLDKIPQFFHKLKLLLHVKGEAFIDSSDLIYLYENGYNIQGYYGQMQYTLKYNEHQGAPFPWLFLDKENLVAEAEIHGFKCEIIIEGSHYDYLAKLTHWQ